MYFTTGTRDLWFYQNVLNKSYTNRVHFLAFFNIYWTENPAVTGLLLAGWLVAYTLCFNPKHFLLHFFQIV